MNIELSESVAGLSRMGEGAKLSHLNIVLISLNVSTGFAGMSTAIVAGGSLSELLDMPLRIIVLKKRPVNHEMIMQDTRVFLEGHFAAPTVNSLTIVYLEDLASCSYNLADKWIATFWMTAYALRELANLGRVAEDCVLYLIQDYEPGFYPFGSEYALANSTYEAKFNWLINSISLSNYLDRLGFYSSERGMVFCPQIDRKKIMRASEGWQPAEDIFRIAFYGRPNHPRNMFDLGVEALRIFVDSVEFADRKRLQIVSVGDTHDPVDLGGDVVLHPIGKLPIDEYYELLSTTDICLTLMQSPHPSHLALEMPMAGIPTVTNSFLDFRIPWLETLHISDPRPNKIAEHMKSLFESEQMTFLHLYTEPMNDVLGEPLSEILPKLVRQIGWD